MVNTNKVPLRRIEGINNYKTNCITEIPQDIKLELADGVLTLKAGSKVYVPNGFEEDGVTPKFDEIVIASDIVVDTATSSTATYKTRIHYREDKACYCNMMVSNSTSGYDNNPIINHGMYYNLTLNKIFYYANTGIAQEKLFSFPLGDVTVSNGVVTSIDNICNGFGYIGSTFFTLPGVRALWSNGFNIDGSLKNELVIISQVLTQTRDNGADIERNLILHHTGTACQVTGFSPSTWKYYPDRNKYVYLNNNDEGWVNVGNCNVDPSDKWKITSFNPKRVFKEVDQNDFPQLFEDNLKQKIKVVSDLPSNPEVGVLYYVKE